MMACAGVGRAQDGDKADRGYAGIAAVSVSGTCGGTVAFFGGAWCRAVGRTRNCCRFSGFLGSGTPFESRYKRDKTFGSGRRADPWYGRTCYVALATLASLLMCAI